MKTNIEELIAKYNEGVADPFEIQQIETLIEHGKISLTQLSSLEKLNEQIELMKGEAVSVEQDNRFHQMLRQEKQKIRATVLISWPRLMEWMPRLALAAAMLIAGFSAGYYYQKPSGNYEVGVLSDQVKELKEMMMISLLEKESATERLKAVSLTEEIDGPSKKVTEALLNTLNEDESVNVRLAALEALGKYMKKPHVREGLVRSIAKQDSPLVQVALAEMMVTMREKSSVNELKKVLEQIQSGQFAKEWIAENDEGLHKFNSLRDENAGHPIEEVGKKLRNMMPFLKNQS